MSKRLTQPESQNVGDSQSIPNSRRITYVPELVPEQCPGTLAEGCRPHGIVQARAVRIVGDIRPARAISQAVVDAHLPPDQRRRLLQAAGQLTGSDGVVEKEGRDWPGPIAQW